MLHRLYFLFIFLVLSAAGLGHEPDVKLTQKQWQEITKGVDYTENFKEPESEKAESSNTSSKGSSWDLSGFKYLFYIIVVAIVVLLIVKILSNLNMDPTIRQENIGIDSMDEIEERMHEVNLDALLAEALRVRNFRIALRIKFLIIIKKLSQTGYINWAKEKTNWEYYSEVNDQNLSGQFKAVILGFERVWYGDHDLTEDQYNLVSPSYEKLIDQLAPHE